MTLIEKVVGESTRDERVQEIKNIFKGMK